MAHLWSKFTKCLRPSKGASDPIPECCPSERTMPRHSPLLRRCYHHLAARNLPLFIYRSLLYLVSFYAAFKSVFHLSAISRAIEGSSAYNEYNVDKKIFPAEIIYLRTMRCDALSFIYGNPSVKHDRRKLPSELIAVRYLTKYAHAYNWILFMDFIQNVYRWYQLQKACPESARRIGPLPSTRGPSSAFLSFQPEL